MQNRIIATTLLLTCAAASAQTGTVISDDFSSYAAGETIWGDDWRPKWDNKDVSQQSLITGSRGGYAVLSGKAKKEYHTPNQHAFTLGTDGRAVISTDFRYVYAGGGPITGEVNKNAFGFLLSTSPNWWGGRPATFCIVNRGLALGNLVPFDPWAQGWMLHKDLGIDLENVSTSKWLNLTWTVYDKDGMLEGRAVVSDGPKVLHESSPVALKIPSDAILYTGFTTGWSETDTDLTGFSRIREVHFDNFKVRGAPAPLGLISF